jgi:hypothetical protein
VNNFNKILEEFKIITKICISLIIFIILLIFFLGVPITIITLIGILSALICCKEQMFKLYCKIKGFIVD